jgi:hypothetical protein
MWYNFIKERKRGRNNKTKNTKEESKNCRHQRKDPQPLIKDIQYIYIFFFFLFLHKTTGDQSLSNVDVEVHMQVFLPPH